MHDTFEKMHWTLKAALMKDVSHEDALKDALIKEASANEQAASTCFLASEARPPTQLHNKPQLLFGQRDEYKKTHQIYKYKAHEWTHERKN